MNKIIKTNSIKSNITIVFYAYFIWRILDFLIIYLSARFIPYLGFFPYRELLNTFQLPHFINSLANFDGLHYLLIAQHNYSQYEQAFFPFYPLLIKLTASLFFNNELIAGLIISNVCFLFGLIIFIKLSVFKSFRNSVFVLILVLTFPTSFFAGAVYTEGLFFMLVVLVLYFLKKDQYWPVVIFAILASLTRLIGIFLIFPIIFHLIKQHKTNGFRFWVNIKGLIALFSPLIGLAIYCLYLYKTTGDPFFFLSSQPAFGANRSTHLIFIPQVIYRYIRIFMTASFNFQYFISVLELVFFSFVFVILILDLYKNFIQKNVNYDHLGLSLFSFAGLIIPTLTGTLSSVPRYSFLCLSIFFFISEIKNIYIKTTCVFIFFILHIVLLGLFSQGYFVS